MEEIWLNVRDYIGLYQVSNWGRVKSVERDVESSNRWGKCMKHYKEKIKEPTLDTNGYLVVCLWKNGTQETKKVHVLVAEAFIPNSHNYEHVHHKDKNQLNNHVENLEWLSKEEHESKHADEKAKVVYQLDLETQEIVNVWKSCHEAARVLGFDNGHISACCLGKLKTYKGFGWLYSPLEQTKKGEDFNLTLS